MNDDVKSIKDLIRARKILQDELRKEGAPITNIMQASSDIILMFIAKQLESILEILQLNRTELDLKQARENAQRPGGVNSGLEGLKGG